MFTKSALVSILVLSLGLQASAHALIAPMLGVTGQPVRDDVQRPSDAKPCGNIDIASTIDSSTTVSAFRNGTFNVTVTSFNGGQDGSRNVSVKIDPTGTGSNFVDGTIQKNGDENPASSGNQSVIAALPAGMKCTGGKSQDLCLASFITTAGFGNCVVIRQVTPTGRPGSASSSISPSGTPTPSAFPTPGVNLGNESNPTYRIGTTRVGIAGNQNTDQSNGSNGAATATEVGEASTDAPSDYILPVAGSRAARALRHAMKLTARRVQPDVTRRGVMSWAWA